MFLFKKKTKRKMPDRISVLGVISVLDRFSGSGLLTLDERNRRVVISATLARVFIGNMEKWEGFIHNVYLWMLYNLSTSEWKRIFLDAETEAIRQARKKYVQLTPGEIAQVRSDARRKVDVNALPLPEVSGMDFVVTSVGISPDSPEAIVVGRYADGKMLMKPIPEGGFRR